MDYVSARHNMVESQIWTNRIDEPALCRALAEVPREVFLPKAMRNVAYVDDDLPVGGGRFLIEPLVLGRLLQGAAIRPTDVVLVVGDATGYVTAVAARLASFVVALDCDGEWVQRASASLNELGAGNVEVVQGGLDQGHRAKAPYDAIVFAGAVGEIPAVITRQLGDGGRLMAVVRGRSGVGRGTLVLRAGDTWGRRELFDAATPALPGQTAKPHFVL